MRKIEANMTHPSHTHFPLFCEEGLPYGMFLSRGRLITFLDSAVIVYEKGDYAVLDGYISSGISVSPKVYKRLAKERLIYNSL